MAVVKRIRWVRCVQAEQRQSQQFFTADKVMQIRSGVAFAGHAAAAGIQGRVVVAEAGIAQIPAFNPTRAVPCRPRRVGSTQSKRSMPFATATAISRSVPIPMR